MSDHINITFYILSLARVISHIYYRNCEEQTASVGLGADRWWDSGPAGVR